MNTYRGYARGHITTTRLPSVYVFTLTPPNISKTRSLDEMWSWKDPHGHKCSTNMKLRILKLRIVKLLFLTHDDELGLRPLQRLGRGETESARALRRIDSWTRSTDLDTSPQSEFCSGVPHHHSLLRDGTDRRGRNPSQGHNASYDGSIASITPLLTECPQMVRVIHGIRIVWESFHTPVTPRQN